MARKRKPNKGTLIADESANREYVALAIQEGWTVITIPPSQRGIKLTDTQVATRYTKGIHPIFTSDLTAYRYNPPQGGATGYIMHVVVRKELHLAYSEQLRRFFASSTERQIRGKRILVPFAGEPEVTRLDEAA
jgi:hypothetical protein